MSIIDDDLELDRILETTNFDDCELIDIPMESDELQDKLTSIRLAPASDTPSSSGLAPRKGSSRELYPGVDSCQGCSQSSPLHAHVQTCVRKFLEEHVVTKIRTMKI